MTTYNTDELDMAADIADDLSAAEIRNVSELVKYVTNAPEDAVQFGERIPLIRNGGGEIGDITIDEDETWVFDSVTKKSKKSAPAEDADDEAAPAERPRNRRR